MVGGGEKNEEDKAKRNVVVVVVEVLKAGRERWKKRVKEGEEKKMRGDDVGKKGTRREK